MAARFGNGALLQGAAGQQVGEGDGFGDQVAGGNRPPAGMSVVGTRGLKAGRPQPFLDGPGLVLPAAHGTFGEHPVLPFIAEHRREIGVITQVQHLFQRGRRHRSRVLPPDLDLSRCPAFVIGLEIQPQIFVLVVGPEPGRHAAIVTHDLDQTHRGPARGRGSPRTCGCTCTGVGGSRSRSPMCIRTCARWTGSSR